MLKNLRIIDQAITRSAADTAAATELQAIRLPLQINIFLEPKKQRAADDLSNLRGAVCSDRTSQESLKHEG
jgi:hypothetical protein